MEHTIGRLFNEKGESLRILIRRFSLADPRGLINH